MQSDNVTLPFDPAAAAAAQVKLPKFSTIDASMWFWWAEVQFCLKRITSSTTQADHILASLLDELFPHILELLISKGDTAIEYSDLKAMLHSIGSIASNSSYNCPNSP
ncbi:hypothetical protein E2C01_054976 [Portunus trituberculatus]|uniref:DUF7041 domain-containing protein n=1 Tax=Portunus trituberculatus TaxID=210409 RepID=A0A5B7GTL8_PORTR|nr:hypothetical protein [Portunus trituberculatus]